MTGPRPAGRPWTPAEVAQLQELISSGVQVGLIARKLKRSPGAIHARISSFKKTPPDIAFGAKRRSLPSERLAFAVANFQSRKIGGPLVRPRAEGEGETMNELKDRETAASKFDDKLHKLIKRAKMQRGMLWPSVVSKLELARADVRSMIKVYDSGPK